MPTQATEKFNAEHSSLSPAAVLLIAIINFHSSHKIVDAQNVDILKIKLHFYVKFFAAVVI